ncbi:MAG: glycosyltransferase family 2 protein [Candidatus Marinimicrobia bacterium]|nr:glycosyltransferase family 2 protein [Candidatus Neomarinimicrobiota bacterium]
MKEFIEKYDHRVQRFLEILPGALAWTIILFPLWGAFFIPKIVAYFTVGFLVFWFYRSFQAAFLGLAGYIKIKQANKTNWQQQYKKDKDKDSLDWKEIRHLVIIPNYNESVEKLATTLDCLVKQKQLDKKQLYIVLAMEARAEGSRQRAKELVKRYQGQFGELMTTFHPDKLPGEVRGKASNEAWGAKQAKKILMKKKKFDLEKMTITSCDADACFHPHYFSALTYAFALNPQRHYCFWQSPIFWHNNFWRVPAFVRIVGTMGNIAHVSQLLEPESLYFNYSTYSASLKMLDEVDYWHTDIIPEDWHIFLQCFFSNQGKVEVEPIFLPTSIDAPEGRTYFGSLKNRYLQCRRHAWGCTDIPYAIKQAFKHPEIPLWTKIFRIYKLVETHIIWSTNWFILTLGAWLPALVNPVFKQTALGYNLPRISRIILTICLAFLFVIIVLDYSLRPKRPKGLPRWQTALEYVQWILMPVAALFMSVIPGLHSQTQLMTGKRMEYRVTEKV